MKLFLTSAGLPIETRKYFLKLLPKKEEKIVVGFIPTAADPEKNKSFVDIAKDEVIEIGMQIKEIDLKEENQRSLLDKLSGCDVIYVNGGNTFYLMDWMRKSGFDKIIRKLLDGGKIYLGVSAGSYVACPTIEAAGWKHSDRNVVRLEDLAALNLVPFLITAHFTQEYRPVVERAAKLTQYPIVALNDKQAVLITDRKTKIVGEGEKIVFNNFKES